MDNKMKNPKRDGFFCRLAHNKNGDTLVSVIIAFVLFLIGIAVVSTSIMLSLGIAEKSRLTHTRVNTVMETYYEQKYQIGGEAFDSALNVTATASGKLAVDDIDDSTLFSFALILKTTEHDDDRVFSFAEETTP